MITIWAVHIAAPPVGLVQRCIACMKVLCDNTAWFTSGVTLPPGCLGTPAWWETGGRVSQAGLAMYPIPAGREMRPEEQWCGGAN